MEGATKHQDVTHGTSARERVSRYRRGAVLGRVTSALPRGAGGAVDDEVRCTSCAMARAYSCRQNNDWSDASAAGPDDAQCGLR